MSISVYKWKINANSSTYYAYIASEESGKGCFIYDVAQSKRSYGSETLNGQVAWETNPVNTSVEEEIFRKVSYYSGGEYDSSFNLLNQLISFVLGSQYQINGSSESYFNLDNSVCGVAGEGVCPSFSFESVSVTDEADSHVEVTSGVTNGKVWYHLKFFVYGPTGPQGLPGSPGPQGIQGNDGNDGAAGRNGVDGVPGQSGKGRNVMAFLCVSKTSGITANDIKPSTNSDTTNGKYYIKNGEGKQAGDIVYPIVNGFVWGDSNECGNADVWMTCGNFEVNSGQSANTFVYATSWSTPIKINGADGDNGKDGAGIEFIYFCPPDGQAIPDTPESPVDGSYPRVYVNGAQTSFFWQNHPSGISQTQKIEFMSSRVQISTDATPEWGDWTTPVIWAKWGEDGTDGDGVEYIFASGSSLNAYSDIEAALSRINALSGNTALWDQPEIYDWLKVSGASQNVNYAPWTDDPSDVSPSEPYEWVSIRRRKWDFTDKKGKYGPFSKPKLWAKWASTPILIDLTRESVGLGTGNDWKYDGDALQFTTVVYAKSSESSISNLQVEAVSSDIDTVLVSNVSNKTDEKLVTVTVPDQYDFSTIDGHSILVNISATATTSDNEVLSVNLAFNIFATQAGKDGELLALEPSCGSIVHDLSNNTFIPSTISAKISCDNCNYNGVYYCVGEWPATGVTGATNVFPYIPDVNITLSSLSIDENATFIRFKAVVDDIPLHCDVPVIPTGKSSARAELSDSEFLIGTGDDEKVDLVGGVTADSYLYFYYGNEKILASNFRITNIRVKRGVLESSIAIGVGDNGALFDVFDPGVINITFANSETDSFRKVLTFYVGNQTYLNEGISVTFTVSGTYGTIACEGMVTYKILGVKGGADGHFFLVKVEPEEIICTPDRTEFYGTNRLILRAFEVVGQEETALSTGIFAYTAYTANNAEMAKNSITVNSYDTALDILGNGFFNQGFSVEQLSRIEIRYYASLESMQNSGLYDNKTIFVRPLAESIGTADYDDDTWIISTGEGDNILDTTGLTKTVKINVWYGSSRANASIDENSYEIRQNGVALSSSNPNYSKIHIVNTVVDGIIATEFSLDSGLDLNMPYEISPEVEGSALNNSGITFICHPVFKIGGICNGEDGESYDIIASPSSIQKDTEGEFITTAVTLNVVKKGVPAVGGNLSYQVYDSEGNAKSTDFIALVGNQLTAFTETRYLDAKYIKVQYRRDGNLWDEETIPVVCDGLNAHRVVLQIIPDDLTCSNDKQTFYESAVTVQAFDIVGTGTTQIFEGEVIATGYEENSNDITTVRKSFTATGGTLTFNVNEVSNNVSVNLHRIEFYYTKPGTQLSDYKTVTVFPRAASLATADFNDDTWYISTGVDDENNVLDTTGLTKTTALNVWFGDSEFTGATITDIKFMKNGNGPTYNVTGNTTVDWDGGVSVDFANLSAVTFTLESGINLTNAIEILFTLSGSTSNGINFRYTTAKFIIAGLRQGVDGESYHLFTNAKSIYINKEGDFVPSSMTISVKHTIGNNPQETPSEGEVDYCFYDSDGDMITSGVVADLSSAYVSSYLNNFSEYTSHEDIKSIYLSYKLNNEILDEERITVLKDGENSNLYNLVVSPKLITLNDNGVFAISSITMSVIHIDGESQENFYYSGTLPSPRLRIKCKRYRNGSVSATRYLEINDQQIIFNPSLSELLWTDKYEIILYHTGNDIEYDIETVDVAKYNGLNNNILLRTNFNHQLGLEYVKEEWKPWINPRENSLDYLWENISIDSANTSDGLYYIKITSPLDNKFVYQDFTQVVTERLKPDTWYTLSFTLLSNVRMYTFIFGYNYNNNAAARAVGNSGIADNNSVYIQNDGVHEWTSSYNIEKEHTFSFKTVGSSDFNNLSYICVIFRAINRGDTVRIKKVKLEKGVKATPFTYEVSDAKDYAPFYTLETNTDNITVNLVGDVIPGAISGQVNKNSNGVITVGTKEGVLNVYKISRNGEKDLVRTINETDYFGINISNLSIDNTIQIALEWLKDNVVVCKKTIAITRESTGKMLYSAGVWDSDTGTTYEQTETTTPFVCYNDKFYYLSSPTADSGDTPGESSAWVEMQKYAAVLADTVIANMAKMGDAVFYNSFMFSEQGRTADSSGVISSAITTGYTEFLTNRNGDISLTEDENLSVYKILLNSKFVPSYFINFKTGEFYSDKGFGSIRSLYYNIKDFEKSSALTIDSITVPTDSEFYNKTYYVPCGMENIGRIMRYTNSHEGLGFTHCYFTLAIPNTPECENVFFYENGAAFKKIVVSNEHIELVGYGNSYSNPVFYGWIVTSRNDIMCNSMYGANFKYMAEGKISINPYGTPYFENGFSFDGQRYGSRGFKWILNTSQHSASTLDIEYGTTEDLGNDWLTFRMNFPVRWFQGKEMPNLIFTPFSQYHPYIADYGKTYALIAAHKDTSFYFMINNAQNLWSQSISDVVLYRIQISGTTETDEEGYIIIPSSGTTNLKIVCDGINGSDLDFEADGDFWARSFYTGYTNYGVVAVNSNNTFIRKTGRIIFKYNSTTITSFKIKQREKKPSFYIHVDGGATGLTNATLNINNYTREQYYYFYITANDGDGYFRNTANNPSEFPFSIQKPNIGHRYGTCNVGFGINKVMETDNYRTVKFSIVTQGSVSIRDLDFDYVFTSTQFPDVVLTLTAHFSRLIDAGFSSSPQFGLRLFDDSYYRVSSLYVTQEGKVFEPDYFTSSQFRLRFPDINPQENLRIEVPENVSYFINDNNWVLPINDSTTFANRCYKNRITFTCSAVTSLGTGFTVNGNVDIYDIPWNNETPLYQIPIVQKRYSVKFKVWFKINGTWREYNEVLQTPASDNSRIIGSRCAMCGYKSATSFIKCPNCDSTNTGTIYLDIKDPGEEWYYDEYQHKMHYSRQYFFGSRHNYKNSSFEKITDIAIRVVGPKETSWMEYFGVYPFQDYSDPEIDIVYNEEVSSSSFRYKGQKNTKSDISTATTYTDNTSVEYGDIWEVTGGTSSERGLYIATAFPYVDDNNNQVYTFWEQINGTTVEDVKNGILSLSTGWPGHSKYGSNPNYDVYPDGLHEFGIMDPEYLYSDFDIDEQNNVKHVFFGEVFKADESNGENGRCPGIFRNLNPIYIESPFFPRTYRHYKVIRFEIDHTNNMDIENNGIIDGVELWFDDEVLEDYTALNHPS